MLGFLFFAVLFVAMVGIGRYFRDRKVRPNGGKPQIVNEDDL